MNKIVIKGARTHNLKSINLTMPRDGLIVLTGVSGSGKSSLAFATLYAEGQRRYVESLSSYARQFLSMMDKPDVDMIEGLSPAISIEQKTTSHNPRSTVGTTTEIYDYMRLLYARVGTPHCPEHHHPLLAQTITQMIDQITELPLGSKWMLLAPVVRDKKGDHIKLLKNLQKDGYLRVRINGEIVELDEPISLSKYKKHTIEVVIDRFSIQDNMSARLADSVETTLNLSEGIAILTTIEGDHNQEKVFSSRYACPVCGYSLKDLEPKLFSFNSPSGACSDCDGLGVKEFFDWKAIIPDQDLTFNQGVIQEFGPRYPYYFNMIKSLASFYQFSMDDSFSSLTDELKNIILYGSNKVKIPITYRYQEGKEQVILTAFEGVMPIIENRYHMASSLTIKEHLARFISRQKCPTCHGARLNRAARHVFVDKKSLPELTALSIKDSLAYLNQLSIPGHKGEIAKRILLEIINRLRFLMDVGLSYLTLNRSTETLSGGEAQRIRLASQIGSGLVGVMYILDEPSIGLHQRDNQRLLNTLLRLKQMGNTVIVVEHDEDTIRASDYIVDIGPGAGVHGGHVVAKGSVDDLITNPQSLTGQYLSKQLEIVTPTTRLNAETANKLLLRNCFLNNLKKIDVAIPLGLMVCVTGVSGSGKSTLINETLYPIAAKVLNGVNVSQDLNSCTTIEGFNYLDKCIDINQKAIGRTPRSNPATYTGILTPIRELFAATVEAKARGYKPGRFSFNIKGGRCEVCQGDGLIKVSMHFLPDMYVDCEACHGKRYNAETLQIKYKDKTIAQVLDMTVEEAVVFFSAIPILKRKLQTLMDVGLGYIQLGQSATTLSGGEAQRIKLSKELSKRSTGNTLYILDEPTTGLHFHDVKQLLSVLLQLRDQGNTIVIVEHNMSVIKTADWVIDLGPEGGDEGGQIIAQGTPEQLALISDSYTGYYLKQIL